jgi:acetylornithine/succinyldiaminopimelate/putrescine aminotransferase
MGKLLHAMGDVHPHKLKAQLARELSRITFQRWDRANLARRLTGKSIFTNSGFEAVEAALKTAILATGKKEVLAFRGAYHGVGYGALNATHREHFRAPFRPQLRQFCRFAPFPKSEGDLRGLEGRLAKLLRQRRFGAVLVEPIQVRGGVNIPPDGFLPLLRQLTKDSATLLVLDEIYTGFGRTGAWFACEHSGTVPDLICLGKALTGGFPLSACVGRAAVIDAAWSPSSGEAIHTSTFLGHPVGCAMALAQIGEIERNRLPERSAQLGSFLLEKLRSEISPWAPWVEIRGIGLLAGVELRRPDGSAASRETWRTVKNMLRRGFIVLPEGALGNIIALSPPLTISKGQITRAAGALRESLREAFANQTDSLPARLETDKISGAELPP